MEDGQIIELFFRRSEDAIAKTQEKYGRKCMAAAGRILPDERDAQECVSDAYLRLWNSIPPQKPRSLFAYLIRVTRNLALDRYDYNRADRRNSALTEAFEDLEEYLPSGKDGMEDIFAGKELADQINAFLKKQSVDSRTYFIRRYWYGESVKEIAQACSVSSEKVKTSLFRTKNRLRETLLKEGFIV